MTTDTRTTNQNYPLPYPSNLLAADVVRLRDALTAIDADMANTVSSADVTSQVNAAVAALVASAPEALNTLDELAQALADDSSFASTMTNSLDDKLDKSGGALTGQVTLPNNPTAGTLQAATARYKHVGDQGPFSIDWEKINRKGNFVMFRRFSVFIISGYHTCTSKSCFCYILRYPSFLKNP